MSATTAPDNLVQHPHAAAPRPAAAPTRDPRDTMERSGRQRTATHGPFVPILLVSLAFLGWLGFQSMQLWNERAALRAALANQNEAVQNAAKMRAQLDGVAAGAARLAQQGNPNAKLLVEELARRGVTINPGAAGQPAR